MENKKPAIFLDRDGCVTVEKSYVKTAEDMEIYPFAKKCVDRIHELGYWAIVITNQYYCPHWHNENSTLPQYNIECDCRKPNTGMIEKAKKDFDIDIEDSYFVGDRATDLLTGKKAGTKAILVRTGYGSGPLEKPVTPDGIYDSLEAFVRDLT